MISDAGAVGHASDAPIHPPGHNFTHGLRAAAVGAIINGTTISIEAPMGTENVFQTQLLPAFAAKELTLSQLRAAATRALLPRFRVGLYDPPGLVPWNDIPADVIESEAHHALARRAAGASFVLLKNAGVLPLRACSPNGGPSRTIAVVGFGANSSQASINRYSGKPNRSTSVWEGVSAAATDAGWRAVWGGSWTPTALGVVNSSDVAVVVLSGEKEGESHDRERLGLPDEQHKLLSLLIATQVPLVVCTISGGAVDVELAHDHAAAVIAMYAGGMEAGAAVADVIFGHVNPSGALAATVYKDSWVNVSDFLSMGMRTGLGRSYRYLRSAAASHVLYPFGTGLSYSNWSVVTAFAQPSGGTISTAALSDGASIQISITIKNTAGPVGSRASWIMLRRCAPKQDEEWPNSWLPVHGFAKVHDVTPGSSASLTLNITARDLSRWDQDSRRFTVRPGAYELTARDVKPTALPMKLVVTA